MARRGTPAYYLLTAIVAVAVASADEAAGIAIPQDPDAVVLTVDQVGGYEPPRVAETPRIVVFADGRIRLGARYDGEEEVTAWLEEGELQEIVAFAVTEQDLFAYDEEEVEFRMRAEAGLGVDPLPVEDAPVTVVEVRLADRRKVVRQAALDFALLRYPTIAELRRLKDVVDRLESAVAIASLGGVEAATGAVLDPVNAAVKEAHPELPAETFASADLRIVAATRDGQRVYRMSRKGCCGFPMIMAVYTIPARGEEQRPPFVWPPADE